VIAIGLVIASGVGVLVMALSVQTSLQITSDAYYDRYQFGDVFAGVKRAPESIASRIADIPGVRTVQTRIGQLAILDIQGFDEPVIGRLASIPERSEPLLNKLALRAGRFIAPDNPNEVVLNEPFAEAHDLRPGDQFSALMNGKRRTLRVVGIALSPEYVYAIGPGALMPDDQRFGVIWMGRKALAAAYDLDGAFNDVSLTLLRGAAPEGVIEHLDQLLERYGGVGAIARKDQISNWFLMNEIQQISTMATIMPTIFLLVAAFLANTVLARLISTERTEIGLMKAFGYSNGEIILHYVKLVCVMASFGIVLGWGVGAVFGRITTELYAELYRFPLLIYSPGLEVFALGTVISLAAALAGTISVVRRAAELPPAESMRPPEPPIYKQASGLTARLTGWLDQPTRIVLRHIGRTPVRSVLTSLAVALSVAVVIMAMQWMDSINHLVQVHFVEGQRQDLMIGLVEPDANRAIHEFARLPGVLSAEGSRIVGAHLRAGPRSYRGSVQGVRPDDRLQLIYDVSGEIIRVPPEGLVVSTTLAEKLEVGLGDMIEVEILEGRRSVIEMPVVRLFETYIGMPAYMNLETLSRLLLEQPSIEYANLLVDKNREAELYRQLKDMPEVSAIMIKQAAIDTFYKTMAETMLIFVTFFAVFAFALGFGVIYNSARISLSERGRDLATLRVLGMTRLETAYILLSEVGLLVVIALPLGCIVGYMLAAVLTASFATELFRIPLMIEASTYGMAILLALASTAVSAAFVRRRLNGLDMIAVLKTRE
ncbi:MAG: ABC transporter permease, partial [Gammaproteobacteria bacterium]|nr:ABC transporter permease [Gammaproteobacteria bacterium]